MQSLLNTLALEYQQILAGKLIGFYVHGSLAMGCFNSKHSDIDFLVVASNRLSDVEKRRIIDLLIRYSQVTQGTGLEMSVIRQNVLDHFTYPTPFELHFSYNHLKSYLADPNYMCGDDVDPDFAAHCVVTKARGICILGQAISDVFPNIPEAYFLQSVLQDTQCSIKNILNGPDTGGCEAPRYAVLNFCRVLAYLECGDIFSKLEGGQWALRHVPGEYHTIVQQAISQYLYGKSAYVSAPLLKQFARYYANMVLPYNNT